MEEVDEQTRLEHFLLDAAWLCRCRKRYIVNAKAFDPRHSVGRRAFCRGSFAWSSHFLGTDELGNHNLRQWLRL